MAENSSYPPIGDYALIADSNSVALVSHEGSIDWCCIQRIDAGSCFGRMLDWEKGGFCSIKPVSISQEPSRRYVDDSLVLETTFHAEGGEARLYDCFTLPASEEMYPQRQIIRVIEGVSGHVELDLKIEPRFDYGSLKPWIRQEGVRLYSVIGGNDGLLISCDEEITPTDNHGLEARVSVHAGQRVRLSIISVPPEKLDYEPPKAPEAHEIDQRLQGHHRVVVGLGFGVTVRRTVQARRSALGHRHKGAHEREDRRHRRGSHDLAPREPRRSDELGLPL